MDIFGHYSATIPFNKISCLGSSNHTIIIAASIYIVFIMHYTLFLNTSHNYHNPITLPVLEQRKLRHRGEVVF